MTELNNAFTTMLQEWIKLNSPFSACNCVIENRAWFWII